MTEPSRLHEKQANFKKKVDRKSSLADKAAKSDGNLYYYWSIIPQIRGHSSAGRAPALQAGGRRFDPVWLHHFLL